MTDEWTVGTLKELLETRLTAYEKAVEKADAALREYKVQANEFRGTLKDQSAEFIRRGELESALVLMRTLLDAQAKQILELQRTASVNQGESNAAVASRVNTRWLIALTVTIILAAVGFVLTVRPIGH